MHEDFEGCYRAVQSKDARFDGWFVTAVSTTKIYCRPSCPARSPLARNVAFYRTAAAAQHAGFRACKRCRPDASPGSPECEIRQDMVKGAAALGLPTTLATLTARSRRWQLWRSYAVQYLWATLDHPINHWTAEEPPWT